jgi:hypothetical protein
VKKEQCNENGFILLEILAVLTLLAFIVIPVSNSKVIMNCGNISTLQKGMPESVWNQRNRIKCY